jgi:hypothetical protein
LKSDAPTEKTVGAVMVIGGGIAGIHIMAGLDKTFPTNDCAI